MLGMTDIYRSGDKNTSAYGDDASVIPVDDRRYLVQNIDVFTPIVDEPEAQGRIAACNLTNDLFACGVLDISTLLSFLATPLDVPKWVLAEILNGMQSFVKSLGTTISKGQTIQNPWILVGGVATGFVEKEYLVSHSGIKPGDVIILTKPLGIQSVMAMARLIKTPEAAGDIASIVPQDEIQPTINRAVELMTTSNRPVVEAIRTLSKQKPGDFKAHAMTDVTGFGLAGHAGNLAVASAVDIEITRVPVLKHSLALSDLFGYPLKEARAAETAGGMLVAIAKTDEKRFLSALRDKGIAGHVVGRAKTGTGITVLSNRVEYVEI